MPSEKKQGISYPRGVCPAARRFAMSKQLELLERALASWPRRHAPLLEVNCGNGAFLQFLWQAGFDVHATEADPELRLNAQKRQVPGLEVYAAEDYDLPFDNDEFDWVVIHLKNGGCEGIRQSMTEGVRLAKRGIMLTFWNSVSLPAFCWRVFHKKPWAVNAVSWWLVWRQMSQLGAGRLNLFSTLAAPVCAWRKQLRIGRALSAGPLGAWCVIRLDMDSTRPQTPLPLRLDMNLSKARPLIDYAPRRNSASSKKLDQA